MKTTLALFALAAFIGCGSDRGAQPTATAANKNEWLMPADAAAASTAREADTTGDEPTQPQARKADPWDPKDENNLAERMLESVKQEGVVRIASVRGSREQRREGSGLTSLTCAISPR